MNFDGIRGVVLDMDGVLWRGDELLPGVGDFFGFLGERGIPFALATNNSSRSPADYVAKLAKMGIEGVDERQIISSGTATVAYLRAEYPAGSRVHVLGGDGLKAMITAAGYKLADSDVRAVIVGIDFALTYDRLKRAALLIRAGADFIGTNDDATFPMPDGLAPGAGSLLAALRTATDRVPRVMGKPNRPMFDAAVQALGADSASTLMIGDRLNTDIEGAKRAGLRAVLVLTGVSRREDIPLTGTLPDGVYEDLNALRAAWEMG